MPRHNATRAPKWAKGAGLRFQGLGGLPIWRTDRGASTAPRVGGGGLGPGRALWAASWVQLLTLTRGRRLARMGGFHVVRL
jgi:hypothetical protein